MKMSSPLKKLPKIKKKIAKKHQNSNESYQPPEKLPVIQKILDKKSKIYKIYMEVSRPLKKCISFGKNTLQKIKNCVEVWSFLKNWYKLKWNCQAPRKLPKFPLKICFQKIKINMGVASPLKKCLNFGQNTLQKNQNVCEKAPWKIDLN